LNLDSPDPRVRREAEILVRQQVQWASHIGTSAILFDVPATGPIVNTARVVNSALGMMTYANAWVRIRLAPAPGSDEDPWARWNTIRTLCSHNPKLSAVLDISGDIPASPLLRRWFAEPVKVLAIHADAFLENAKGFPVLGKKIQAFIREFSQFGVQFIVTSPAEVQHSAGGLAGYQQYLRHLYRSRPELDVVDRFASGYHDYLQSPLQPLMDNLESATYEVFEKDPIKYREYERAVYHALMDRVPADSDIVTVIMVVGAGRGPLVERSLKAAEAAGRKVRVYAVEKNPNAIVTLKNRKEDEWGDRVTVVHCDMRYWEAPEKTDILVSELLGSFGDNELSPECLDGAQRFLKADGISIPSSYTAYVTPVSSTKLHNEVMSYDDLEHVETPYVVKFRAVHELAEPVAVWRFDHPDLGFQAPPGTSTFNAHNTRYACASFVIEQDATLHGIAGYFESTLYKDI
ncbi:protein arginine N-methyltransferase, partial [Blyttiomyces helicus]